jgi:hypothetical protein
MIVVHMSGGYHDHSEHCFKMWISQLLIRLYCLRISEVRSRNPYLETGDYVTKRIFLKSTCMENQCDQI